MIAQGGSSLTELALAMRESSLVGERVEGVSDGEFLKANLIHYNYRRREEAFLLNKGISNYIV